MGFGARFVLAVGVSYLAHRGIRALRRRRKARSAPASAYAALIFDVEGTTTPISFVKETLFPYVTQHLEHYLAAHYHEAQTRADVEALIELSEKDAATAAAAAAADVNVPVIPPLPSLDAPQSDIAAHQQCVMSNVRWQMSSDRKSTALKALQGHMWKDGYESGVLRGQLFGGATGDVAQWLKRWKDEGYTLGVYSSGSVEAQKLLFRYSDAGNLDDLFSCNFDTRVGMKQESHSYSSIAEQIGLSASPERVLFLTDIWGEAWAAHEAGMDAILLVRPGNYPLPPEQSHKHPFPIAHDFNEVQAYIEERSKLRQSESESHHGQRTRAATTPMNETTVTPKVDTSSGEYNTF